MDHEATREQLELAALEPGGLDRLMAGDTPEAQAVAAHLAGCAACTDELARLQRTAVVIRSVVRDQPSPELRERTLSAIRAEGVRRPVVIAPPPIHAGRPRSAMLGRIATVAAAIVLSVVTTSLIVGARVDDQAHAQAQQIAALEHVTTAEMAVAAQPDARFVSLAGVSDPTVDGQITFSPSTTELVIVADGLQPPTEGQEYRCWIEVDGQRQGIGRMYFSDDLSFWAGDSPELADAPADARFGITLVNPAGSGLEAQPVLVSGG